MINNKKNILVSVAWPYANGGIHIGHMAGCYLPADIFARYMRLKGENVVFVTGSDEHGTAIEVEALKREVTPFELTSEIHQKIVHTLKRFDISTLERNFIPSVLIFSRRVSNSSKDSLLNSSLGFLLA